MIVVNAANIDKDWDWLKEQNIKFNNKLELIFRKDISLCPSGSKSK